MTLMIRSRFKTYIFAAVAALLASCAAERSDIPEPVAPGQSGGLTLRLTTGEMLPQIVASRADDAPEQKTAEEKKINTVHLFFFDADGNFLTPVDKGDDTFTPYRHYDFTDGKQPYINIPEDVFEEQESLSGVQIYAAVNIEGSLFRTQWTPEGDIVNGHPTDPDAEVTIASLDDLLGWVYRPTVRKDVSRLPDGGMPMVGKALSEVSLGDTKDIDLTLRAMMARVDANVKLSGSQENHDDMLPRMKITEYGVRNLPVSVPFFNDEKLRTDCETIEESVVTVQDPVDIYDGDEVTFSYYTYENLRDGSASRDNFSYPAGVDRENDDVVQRWKPRLAPDGASALVIRGEYWTHQELFYQAQFLFYLGSNTVDNFEVYRNRRYINNVTISGLEYVRNSDENVFTFDARVNVRTDNPVFISIVNERRLDSHWCVLPMDVYFLDADYTGASVEVEITGDATGWISLEYCDASAVDESEIKAGWGCRDYFTENMIEEVAEKKAVVTHNRDRIYFYVDENASDKSRNATINITYRSKDGSDVRERTLELEQAGLLPFTYNGTTYYMETYEEYAEHYDPLDTHEPSPWYQPAGIPWAAAGSGLENKALSDGSQSSIGMLTGDLNWQPFYVIDSGDGLALTKYLMGYDIYSGYSVSKQSLMGLYPSSAPLTAVSLACSKNRKSNDDTNIKWFLPSLGQCEEMMKQLDDENPNFSKFFYWTANTARNPNRYTALTTYGNENPYRARAVKINSNGSVIASEINNSKFQYPTASASEVASDYVSGDYNSISYENGGGRTLRTQPLRVRAIRTADGVQRSAAQ